MTLNVSLDASFSNMWDWKGTWEKVGEVNNMKACIPNGACGSIVV
jgi:hypothetical protein